MALAFSDDFERGNGPVGNGWSAIGAVWQITSGYANALNAGRLQNDVQPSGANCCQRIWIEQPVSGTKSFTLSFRANSGFTDYKQVGFVVGTASVAVSIYKRISNVQTTIATTSFGQYSTGDVDLMASVVGDAIYAYVNGFLVLAVQSPDIADNGLASIGVGGSATYINAYALYDLGGTAYTISAELIPGSTIQYGLTLKNGGADWTSGNPGAPTFAIAQGTIVSQEVLDVETAYVVYEPPEIDAPGYIYDPQNDFLFRFTLSTELGGVGTGGGGAGLTTAQAAALASLADYLEDYFGLSALGTSAWADVDGAAWWLLSMYDGSEQPALQDILYELLSTSGTLKGTGTEVNWIYEQIASLTNNFSNDLNDVIVAIAGPNYSTNDDILAALAALEFPPGSDITTILTQLAAIRTANLWTLGDVVGRIGDIRSIDVTNIRGDIALIRTIASYTLGDVMTAIAAISNTDWSDRFDDLDSAVGAIPTNPITSLQPDLDAIAAVRGSGNPDLAALLTAINGIPTNPVTSLSSVLTAISTLSGHLDDQADAILDAITALTPAEPTPTAPAWPGLANVTLGQAHNLAIGLTITEAMDGVIVSITGAPTKQGYFTFDDARSWRNVGALTFFNDQGHNEYPQTLGFTSALYCPKAMRRAAGVKVRTAPQVTGTVTPWTITPA